MASEQKRQRPLVLVVDDVAPVIRMMTLELNAQGMDVVGAKVGDDTYRTIETRHPDAVVMEVVLPQVPGFELMAEIKRRWDIPVIFVTTQGRDADRQYAIEIGAADYVTKPFAPADLAARIKAVLHDERSAPRRDQLRLGDVEIDLGRRLLRKDGREIPLSTNEWAVMFALAAQRGERVPARDVLIAVWGAEYANDTDYLEVWLRRLRQKIEPDPEAPRIIVGEPDRGYALGRPAADMPATA